MVTAATINTIEYTEQTGPLAPMAPVALSGRPERGITRVSRDTIIDETGWKLALEMFVQLEYTPTGVVAVSPWVDDYAEGGSGQEAVKNLLCSLVDYRESLERRILTAQLSDELCATLEKLRMLLIRGTE